MQATRRRTAAQAGVPWISDGWAAYAEVVADIYCDPTPAGIPGRDWSILHRTPGVALTQAVKHRRGRRLARVEVRATIGVAAEQPHTVHETHAFAKRPATWDAALGLALVEHNWRRCHPALRQPLPSPSQGRRYHRRTPAMALGLTDHRWAFVEFLTHPAPHYTRG